MLFALKNEYLNFALLAAQYDQIARIDLQFGNRISCGKILWPI